MVGRTRRGAAVAALAGLVTGALVTGCGSARPSAGPGRPSGPPPTAATTTSSLSTAAGRPTTSPTPPPTAPVTGPARPTGPGTPCARRAASTTFFHATSAVSTPSGGLTIDGRRAVLICGGPDDFHWDLTGPATAATVVPGAAITVFVLPAMRSEPIRPAQLPSYLADRPESGIFQVTGPLSAVRGLAEQFHP